MNPAIDLHQILRAAEKELREAGVASPKRDAGLLLAHHLGLERHELYLRGETHTEEMLRRFLADVERRARREPLQLILGETGFYGLRFKVRPGVFIPRPETEVLVEWAIELAPKEGGLAYDLGCGIGNIACALAANRPNLRIIATDIFKEAVELTGENAALNGLENRVTAIRANLAEDLTEPAELLCCNPPYIRTPDIGNLEPEVRDHDPRAALDGGSDGLGFYKKLTEPVRRLVKPGGWALLEIGADQGGAVRRLFEVLAEAERVEIRKDLAGRDRVAAVQLK
ncbi:peptide chain release factor N(5)-glutamine methyltransferase [bacterium]|nr:peptide chain release factor N(5)-glutamine methyltransferase [bacterium]